MANLNDYSILNYVAIIDVVCNSSLCTEHKWAKYCLPVVVCVLLD